MNYYKITNKEEIHKGLTYKTGLNVDILPFNPSGNCQPGGIYFAREDIFAFLDYGPWIRQVTLPENETIYKNPDTPEKWKAHQVILGERRKIDLTVIKELIEEGANIHVYSDLALRWAAENGHLDILEYLVSKGADIYAIGNIALKTAAENGHLDIVKFLISKNNDIHSDNPVNLMLYNDSLKNAIRCAAKYGHLDIIKYLISKGADIHEYNDDVLKRATANGHLNIVKYLKSLK